MIVNAGPEETPIPTGRKSSHIGESSLAEILSALGDDTRLRIVRQLADCGELPCGQFDLPLPKSTMSHHFNVLIAAGIIGRRREGTAQFNRLRREELDRQFPGLLDSVLGSSRKTPVRRGRR